VIRTGVKNLTEMKEVKGELIKCPRCNHKWDYVGEANRIKCGKCGKWFQRKYPKKLDKKQIKKIKNEGISEKTLAFLANDFNPVTDRKYLMNNVTIVLGNNLTTQVKNASKTRRIMELDLIELAVKKYLNETYTTKIKNKSLSEETLAFLGTDFDSVTDRSFPRDKIAIILGNDLTIQVKHASKMRKITEYNLIRLAVKKYLEGGE